jgi:hypothetical protein
MQRFTAVQLMGFFVLAVGLMLLALARYGAVDPMSELTSSMTGRDTGHGLWLVGIGAASALAGGLLMLSPTRTTRASPPARTMPP